MTDNAKPTMATPTLSSGRNKTGDPVAKAKAKAAGEAKKKEKKKNKNKRKKLRNKNKNNQTIHPGLIKDGVLKGVTISSGTSA